MISIELRRHLHRRLYSLFNPPSKNAIARALPTHLPQGMDGARYQIKFDPDLATIPLSFAFQKISEGTTYKDTSLDDLWQGVSKLDIRGGYHYMRSGMSWSAQVSNYLSGLKTHNVHALDLEGYGNTYSNTLFADCRRWIDQVRHDTGQKVVLYTNGSTYTQFVVAILNQYSDGQAWLDNLDFWFAWPSETASEPPLQYKRQNAVKPWTFWQDNWNCTKCGCLVASDHNFFNGTLSELYEWAGASGTPEPPPTGGTMYLEATGNITMRVGPAQTYANAQINGENQYVYTGDIIEVAETSNGYAHASRLWRNGDEVELAPVVWFGTYYTKEVAFTPPDEPTGDDDVSSVHTSVEYVVKYESGKEERFGVDNMELLKK